MAIITAMAGIEAFGIMYSSTILSLIKGYCALWSESTPPQDKKNYGSTLDL